MRAIKLVLLSCVCLAAPVAAETLLVNARIHTMDAQRPEAQAMAWDDDGVLVAVGDAAELRARYKDARQIDAGGNTVIPGLIDAHGHVLGLGEVLSQADLSGATSKDEVLARLTAFARELPAEAWLIGHGWDQNRWPAQAFPSAADLDQAFPERPVYLGRIDGHAAWVNSAAMRRAARALDGDWQPEGGHIVRNNGKATGVLVDAAMGLVRSRIPAPSRDDKRAALKRAFERIVASGLTGVHDAGITRADFALLEELADHGAIPLRINAMARDAETLEWLCTEHGAYRHAGGRLRMQSIKIWIDGALGSRGAALIDDYSDEHGNRGLFVVQPDAFRALVRRAHQCGVQVATHAIGDRGNRVVLDTYSGILGADALYTDHRWRVEHAQIVALEDIPRFASLHLIASMQPTHATSDMPWAGQRVGAARLKGAYAWQKFLEEGVPLALGSDFPVEKVNPMLGLYAAVTRQDLSGKPPGGWFPEQRLSRIEALQGFTRGAAYAAFMEREVGQLKAGLRADFVILDADFLTIPAADIAKLEPLSTWVDGRAVFVSGQGVGNGE